MLVFFSALIEVLYHVGAMQIVISAIAALLQLTMKTTPIESFATAAHIFIGQVVARFLFFFFLLFCSMGNHKGGNSPIQI